MPLPAIIILASDEILKAITKLVELLLSNYGPWGTLLIFAAFIALGVAYFIYNEHRKEIKTEMLLREKDKTIQRLNEEARLYRTLFFKENLGYTDEQVERLIIRNSGDFEDGPDARRALEKKANPKD